MVARSTKNNPASCRRESFASMCAVDSAHCGSRSCHLIPPAWNQSARSAVRSLGGSQTGEEHRQDTPCDVDVCLRLRTEESGSRSEPEARTGEKLWMSP